MAMTLDQLLARTNDGELLDIQEELIKKVVPTKGYTHSFIRKVNNMIDDGDLCINESTYRKVYLPTFVRAVQKEMASRYVRVLKGQSATWLDGAYEQMTLDLVINDKQAKMEV